MTKNKQRFEEKLKEITEKLKKIPEIRVSPILIKEEAAQVSEHALIQPLLEIS
jgi:hypothetical protein